MWDWFGESPTPDYDFEVLTCASFSTDSHCATRSSTRSRSWRSTETDFKKRVDLLHKAEKIALVDSPYIFYVLHTHIS